MKSIRFIMCLTCSALALASCVTTNKTAKTADFSTETFNATVADLEVSDQRVTATLNPVPAEVRRGGMKNIKKTVEAKALAENGNADVLVNPEFTYTVERGFFSKKVTSMTVTGRPAKYKNFHSLNDSVWANPNFRGVVVRTGYPSRRAKASFKSRFKLGESNEDYLTSEGGKLRKGFTGGFDVGCSGDFNREKAVPTMYLNMGYNITPCLYAGIGSGADWNVNDDWIFIPVYANVRCYLSKNNSAPFADARVGVSTECNKSSVDGGTYASFALGYRFKAFEISLAYTYQRCEVKNNRYYESSYKSKEDLNRLGLRLGFRF